MQTVFIIDDDPILQKIMSKMVTSYDKNLEVRCFPDGVQAIEALRQKALPDLIFLDINMPNMNAWEFIKVYGKLNIPRVPIYILSSSIDQRDIAKAKSIDHIIDYLIKPMKKDDLYEICKRELTSQK